MFKRYRRKVTGGDEVEPVPELPSAFRHIQDHLSPDGSGLREEGQPLPDDAYRFRDGLKWAPGAADGAWARHTGGQTTADPAKARRIYEELVLLADAPEASRLDRVNAVLAKENARSSVDLVLDHIAKHPPRNKTALYQEMKKLFLSSGHRETVKFAMAVMSLFRNPADVELFKTVGCHEEFTLFAAVEISNIVEDPVPIYLEMARRVHGWGRIEIVDLLLKEKPTPAICDFLVREGCDNTVMRGYTALSIANYCKLSEVLSANTVDPQVLSGASAILESLAVDAVTSGPDGEMFDYPQGGPATEAFLAKFEPHARSLRDFLVVASFHEFISLKVDEDRFQAAGWGKEVRERVKAICDRVTTRPDWREKIHAALDSDKRDEKSLAVEAARVVNLPIRGKIVEALRRDPMNSYLWFKLASGADEPGMDEVLALAGSVLDVNAIAVGPGREHGLGAGYDLHHSVNFIVQELGRFPGKGWALIRPSLLSPIMRDRHMALRALAMWNKDQVTSEVVETLRQTLNDPVEEIRDDCKRILDRVVA